MVGRIFHTGGVHRFYEGDGGRRAEFQSPDLEQVKAALRAKYLAT
jgi:hypothetical protein